ncbi:hypothetical protein DL96DRAFT_1817045 [Flagelloscypha sp. PMI_526]|nr:hypothetical protein DL96DRAFT_1817045 [Flagelloscypha sp. PMI_526]
MPTQYPGTIQQPDVESLYQPPKKKLLLQRWILLTIQLIEISIGSSIHSVACCALGRFMLDHFHLWSSRWIIPPNEPSIEKHAELIAAFMAGCLAGPATYGAAAVSHTIIPDLRRRNVYVRIRTDDLGSWAVYLLVLWVSMAITGAMLHPRFRYLTVGSILGVYGFGALLLFLPSLGLVFYMVERRLLINH